MLIDLSTHQPLCGTYNHFLYGLAPNCGKYFKTCDVSVIYAYGGWFSRKHLCNHSSVLYPRSLIFSHHPLIAAPTFSISYFSACLCLWHHKTGTVECTDSEPLMCVWGISTWWDTEEERDGQRKRFPLFPPSFSTYPVIRVPLRQLSCSDMSRAIVCKRVHQCESVLLASPLVCTRVSEVVQMWRGGYLFPADRRIFCHSHIKAGWQFTSVVFTQNKADFMLLYLILLMTRIYWNPERQVGGDISCDPISKSDLSCLWLKNMWKKVLPE